MDRLIFADGSIVNTDFCVELSGNLHVTLYNLTFLQAAMILADPAKTQEIQVEGSNNYRKTYTGYTELTVLMAQGNHIKAILQEVAR